MPEAFRLPGSVRTNPVSPAGGPRSEARRPVRPLGRYTAIGTGWISLKGCPVRSWIRLTASAEGASDRQ